MPDVTPKTESGRALYREVRSVEWGDEMRRGILAIEQEAASKAVAEVLDRLEHGVANILTNGEGPCVASDAGAAHHHDPTCRDHDLPRDHHREDAVTTLPPWQEIAP